MSNSYHIESKSDENIASLIAAFRSKNGMERQKARLSLIEIGNPGVSFLIEALSVPNKRVRWEAAKTLKSIKDPNAAPALVNLLTDESSQVQWLAAEALIALKRASLVPLLQALAENFDSTWLRHGAHHVLHALEREGLLNKQTKKVLDDLRNIDTRLDVLFSAKTALKLLNS